MTALLPPPHASDPFTDALLGCPDALDTLLRQHRSAVEAVCFRRLRSRIDAEDAVQETMLRGMRALEHVEDPSRLKSYLCRIAERVSLDLLRNGAVAMPYVVEDVPSEDAEPEAVVLENERARLVHQTLEALSERQATALWMRDALGESVPVVAERLGVTEGSARVLLTRARAKMRDGWAKVAALIPGAGLKLPSFAAKALHFGPLSIPAAVPAVMLVAAVAVTPAAFSAMVGNDAIELTRPQGLTGAKAPAGTAPTVDSTTTATAATVRSGSTTRSTPAPPSGSSTATQPPAAGAVPTTSARVGDNNVGVSERDTSPEDDDVTVGNGDLLEVGATADELQDAVEAGAPKADPEGTHAPMVSVDPS